MKRSIILALTLLGGVAHAGENTNYVFYSIHAPKGPITAQISEGVRAATRACDPDGGQHYGFAQFNACMRRYGYRLDHVERTYSKPHTDLCPGNDGIWGC
jgi:hypothetical protein